MALIGFLDSFTDWSKKKVGRKLLTRKKKTTPVQGERPPQNRISTLSKRNRQPVPPGYNPSPHPTHVQSTVQQPDTSVSPPDPTVRPLTPFPESIDNYGERIYKLLHEPPETKTCTICIEVKEISEFSQTPATDKCLHEPAACRSCIAGMIKHCLQANFWTDIRCVICMERLEYKDVAEYADAETFKK